MWFCGFLVETRRGVGTGRGGFLLGIGMIKADIASGDVCAAYPATGIVRNGLADEEASDCTVAVDGRMENSACGMSKEDTLQHVRAGETCSATKIHLRISGMIFTRITLLARSLVARN